jgi:hypothetical protein
MKIPERGMTLVVSSSMILSSKIKMKIPERGMTLVVSSSMILSSKIKMKIPERVRSRTSPKASQNSHSVKNKESYEIIQNKDQLS